MSAACPASPNTGDGAVAVWSPTILGVLAIEAALILAALALAFYLPSRKRDFV